MISGIQKVIAQRARKARLTCNGKTKISICVTAWEDVEELSYALRTKHIHKLEMCAKANTPTYMKQLLEN